MLASRLFPDLPGSLRHFGQDGERLRHPGIQALLHSSRLRRCDVLSEHGLVRLRKLAVWSVYPIETGV